MPKLEDSHFKRSGFPQYTPKLEDERVNQSREKGSSWKQRMKEKLVWISFPSFSFATPSFIKKLSFAKNRILRSNGTDSTQKKTTTKAVSALKTDGTNTEKPTTQSHNNRLEGMQGIEAKDPSQGIYISEITNLSEMIQEFISLNQTHSNLEYVLTGIDRAEIKTNPNKVLNEMVKNISTLRIAINSLRLSRSMLEKIAPRLTHVVYQHLDCYHWPVDQLNDFLLKCKSEQIESLHVSHPLIKRLPFERLPVCNWVSVYNCQNLETLPQFEKCLKFLEYRNCPRLVSTSLPTNL